MLLDNVREYVRRHRLFAPDTRLVVALSGGSDSMALLYLMRELHERGEVRLVGAAHFNHQLRPTASRDEELAESAARSLHLPFLADRADVRHRATHERRSVEDAARVCRYEFFERVRAECAAELVALGHTRDDQAETVLLRLLRGAGPKGLAGMHPTRSHVVRPLLECRRDELRRYLDERRIPYAEDETNADTEVPRNRVRHELLPLLETRFNPAIVETLARQAELARETWVWHDHQARAALEHALAAAVDATGANVLTLDVRVVRSLPRPIGQLVVWEAMERAARPRHVAFDHVASVMALVDGDLDHGALDAPGHRVERIGDCVVLTSGSGHRRTSANLFEYSLSIPGEVRLREAGSIVSAELFSGGMREAEAKRAGPGAVAVVQADQCRFPLAVRNRRPGDRFRPLGVGGGKKLQDYFVDKKVERARRDVIPLVVNGDGRIVWVAGFTLDEAFQVTDASQSVLLLRLTQV